MKPTMKYLTISLILLVAISAAGCSVLQKNTPQALQASGLIEATEIAVAPELSGRVVEVSVAEGDSVKTGAVLFKLDDTLLQAQRKAASAALNSAQANAAAAQTGVDTAQAQYELTLSNALAEAQPTRIEQLKQNKPSEFVHPGWYFSRAENIQSTETEVAAANTALDNAQTNLESIEKKVGSAQFLDAEQRLMNARVAFQIAQDVLDQINGISGEQDLRDTAQSALDDAKLELENAQKAYDDSLTSDGAKDVLDGRAKVLVAQERYDTAMDLLHSLQIGADSPAVGIAARVVDQAKAALEQSQAAITQAQADLDSIDSQIEKLTIRAPLDGVVLTRSVQPGEVLQAGMTALTVAKTDKLTVTVYIPEDRYGEISLGDEATLSVDSFPGESFSAAVTRISDQAEFTPRNVQTKEERQTTVYAVELSVDNPQGKLKPGMPVDVEFSK